MNIVRQISALDLLKSLGPSTVDMVYMDPPFGTGDIQTMNRQKNGENVSKISYRDKFENYEEFLRPILQAVWTVLKPTGTLYLHLDWRWVHYAKVWCDSEFGRDNFVNEIVWSYNYGGRGKNKWPAKHDTILMYAKDRDKMVFNWNAIDRIPYKAPEMQRVGRTKEEADARIALGQVPTDVWTDIPILGTSSRERTGYPSQKPVALVARMILASTNVGDLVVDPFAGSGTTGAASIKLDRHFVLGDVNPAAISTMKKIFLAEDVKFEE